MSVELARGVGPAGIDVAYERFGDASAPSVVLVMGLGTQMLGWPDPFCEALAARGLHVVRFDNRDVGLSTHLHDAPPVDVMAAMTGRPVSAAYTLSDMAADTIGLLDALGLDGVHLVGASMGGMIAQTVAIEFPARVRSLTSIMSSTGDRTVGQPSEAGAAALFAPPATNRADAIERMVSIQQVIGSPGFAFDEGWIRWRAGLSFDRGYDPLGVARQLVAIAVSGDRTAALRTVSVPTLVLHGAADGLVDASGGRATAAAIPGAELFVYDGMGHDLPEPLWGEITQRIAELVERSLRRR